MITTSGGVVYRKMLAHLNPYSSQNKKSQAVHCVSKPMAQPDHMWPVKQLMAQSDHKKSSQVNNQSQVHTSRRKRDTNLPVKLVYRYFNFYLVHMDIYRESVCVCVQVCKTDHAMEHRLMQA